MEGKFWLCLGIVQESFEVNEKRNTYWSRDQTDLWYRYVTPMLNMFQTEFTSTFGKQWSQEVLQMVSSNATMLANIQNVPPQAVNPAVGFSMYNLRPFTPAAATPSVTIGLIYLIVSSFCLSSFNHIL